MKIKVRWTYHITIILYNNSHNNWNFKRKKETLSRICIWEFEFIFKLELIIYHCSEGSRVYSFTCQYIYLSVAYFSGTSNYSCLKFVIRLHVIPCDTVSDSLLNKFLFIKYLHIKYLQYNGYVWHYCCIFLGTTNSIWLLKICWIQCHPAIVEWQNKQLMENKHILHTKQGK